MRNKAPRITPSLAFLLGAHRTDRCRAHLVCAPHICRPGIKSKHCILGSGRPLVKHDAPCQADRSRVRSRYSALYGKGVSRRTRRGCQVRLSTNPAEARSSLWGVTQSPPKTAPDRGCRHWRTIWWQDAVQQEGFEEVIAKRQHIDRRNPVDGRPDALAARCCEGGKHRQPFRTASRAEGMRFFGAWE